jgi:RNA polymerase sigma-70 factor (ECF subfamily)
MEIAKGLSLRLTTGSILGFKAQVPRTARKIPMDPETILDRAHKLDAQALAALHDQFYPVVYRYVRYRLMDEQLVEDIASEVFLRMLDALRHKGTRIREPRAWLLGTASHLIHDHLRQKYRQRVDNIEEHEDFPDGIHPEAAVEQSMQSQQVRLAIQKLTDDQQEVLALRFSMECSLEETALVMEKSVNAVKVLQFRAIAALRKLLEDRLQ